MPLPGETIGGTYLVDGLCARRGQVFVLKAMRLPHGERVAIAVLRPKLAAQAVVVERFLRQGEAAMRVRSEHALRVLDRGLLKSGAPFLVLERVEGQSLEQVVSARGRLPVPTAVDCVLQAIEAVAQAHSYGLAHGDLTPSTMLLTMSPSGGAWIKVDFCAAQMTEERPPDMTWDAAVRRDVRALGAILQFLLTGEPSIGEATALRNGIRRLYDLALSRCVEDPSRAPFTNVAELARTLAPFGTQESRVSCNRIECLLEDRVSELMLRKPGPESIIGASPEPSDGRARIPGAAASGRVVLMGLAMLAALGAAAFTMMYMSVARGEPGSSFGVTAIQPPAADTAATAGPALAPGVDGGE